MTSLTLLESNSTLYATCDAAARRVVANQGWALVPDWDAFVQEVAQNLTGGQATRPGDTFEKRTERAVTRAYCPILYAACCERDGPRCVRAFEELGRYLYAVALRRTTDKDVAREAAQRTLEIVYRHLEDVREPWAFLGYARVVLVREMKPPRKGKGQILHMVPLRGDDPEEPGVQPADPLAEGEQAEVERSTDDPVLRQAIHNCLRSPQQREVILRLFLDEQSVVQVAEALGTTPANVWVLKSRALDRLRLCPDVIAMLGGTKV